MKYSLTKKIQGTRTLKIRSLFLSYSFLLSSFLSKSFPFIFLSFPSYPFFFFFTCFLFTFFLFFLFYSPSQSGRTRGDCHACPPPLFLLLSSYAYLLASFFALLSFSLLCSTLPTSNLHCLNFLLLSTHFYSTLLYSKLLHSTYSLSVGSGYSFFQLETFARVHYFMVRSDRQLSEWMKAFEGLDPVATQVRDNTD